MDSRRHWGRGGITFSWLRRALGVDDGAAATPVSAGSPGLLDAAAVNDTAAIVTARDTAAADDGVAIRIRPRSHRECGRHVRHGVGERLYALPLERLVEWGEQRRRRRSMDETEDVCDALWNVLQRSSLDPDREQRARQHLERFTRRLERLRERAHPTPWDDDEPAAPPASDAEDATDDEGIISTDDDPYETYAIALESALCAWDAEAELRVAENRIAELKPGWLAAELDAARIEQAHARIRRRLAQLERRRQRDSEPAGARRDAAGRGPGNVPGVPEWPEEAHASETEAFGLEPGRFFHAKGMLSFMGYRVGRHADLTPEQRRRILDYVLLGRLPRVNDDDYMRQWGGPNSSERLRKLANTLAAFARNARRRRGQRWQHAISQWEADLAHLKDRYHARYAADWHWPATVRPNRPR